MATTHLVIGFPPSSSEGSKPTSREVADEEVTPTNRGGAACVHGASFDGLDSAPDRENPSCKQKFPPRWGMRTTINVLDIQKISLSLDDEGIGGLHHSRLIIPIPAKVDNGFKLQHNQPHNSQFNACTIPNAHCFDALSGTLGEIHQE